MTPASVPPVLGAGTAGPVLGAAPTGPDAAADPSGAATVSPVPGAVTAPPVPAGVCSPPGPNAVPAPPVPAAIAVARESPLGPDLAPLMARHAAEMHAETPPGSVHMLQADALAHSDVAFFVMRDATGSPVGMGAFRRIDAAHAEIKSMHILSEWRGRGLSRRILDHLLAQARETGIRRLSLETGSQPGFAPARRLYARAGFEKCGSFEGYGPDPASVFMTRTLPPG